jgi:hypothetical protein
MSESEEARFERVIKHNRAELARAKIHGPDANTVDALEDVLRLAEDGKRWLILLEATQRAYVASRVDEPSTNDVNSGGLRDD